MIFLMFPCKLNTSFFMSRSYSIENTFSFLSKGTLIRMNTIKIKPLFLIKTFFKTNIFFLFYFSFYYKLNAGFFMSRCLMPIAMWFYIFKNFWLFSTYWCGRIYLASNYLCCYSFACTVWKICLSDHLEKYLASL